MDFTRQYLSDSREKCLRFLVALIVASISLGLLFALLEKLVRRPGQDPGECFEQSHPCFSFCSHKERTQPAVGIGSLLGAAGGVVMGCSCSGQVSLFL